MNRGGRGASGAGRSQGGVRAAHDARDRAAGVRPAWDAEPDAVTLRGAAGPIHKALRDGEG